MMTNAKINGLVKYLFKYDAKEIEILKTEFSDYTAFLEEEGIAMPASANEAENRFKMRVAKEVLSDLTVKADEIIPKLKTKLKVLNQIQLASQIIVIVSGASVFSLLRVDYPWIKLVAPSLILVSSILTIVVKNRSESMVNDDKSIYKLVSDLITYRSEAKFVLPEIKTATKFYNHEVAGNIIERSNALALKMDDAITKYNIYYA